ncbi:biopolymer transporter ExbD [Flavobacterium indicum]|nr:biopolymer transporter ExbD [Flavobacterium indicum]
MAKVKISKKSTKIDMTAMCDVAFLLLSFFIMTSTAKVPEPKPVDTPASTVQAKLPEHDLATITIGDSAVFFSMTDRDLRVKTLEIMADKYGMEFSEDEKSKFALIDGFGVPLDELKSLIALPGAERNKEGLQKGIPYETPADSTKKSQLGDWVLSSREALVELRTKDLKFAIKADGKEKYPTVKKVLDMMQKQEVNNFYLVTGLRSEDF